jgi:hypothetical protein
LAASLASIDVRVDPYINVVRDAAAWRNRNPLGGGGGAPVAAVAAISIGDPPPRPDDPWLDVPPDFDDPNVDDITDGSGQDVVSEVLEADMGLTCPAIEEDCHDGLDDDEDGLVDCGDSDCAEAPECQQPVEICGNGIDDDGDGAADCGDADCAGAPECQGPVEVCGNGIDDDGDGIIDCGDPDCHNDALCKVINPI